MEQQGPKDDEGGDAGAAAGLGQVEKEVPQEQVVFAFGFSITKPDFISEVS